jgi:carboxymethylenebutenolidase
MEKINRRIALLGLALFPAIRHAFAGAPDEVGVTTDEGEMTLSRYPAAGADKRPAVLVLHGSGGFERKPAAYERYANALQAAGIDAYLVRYMTALDADILKSSVTEKRKVREAMRFDAWAKRISAAIAAVLAGVDSSGRVGLLGFSLGGYVAAATAARDERVGALAVLYGGLPDAMVSEVRRFPPLLELHGDADTNVSLREGERLVRVAKAAGGEAEQVIFPGKQHGFDFSDTDPATSDAIGRVTRFFEQHLEKA